ncbi:unnamed protein product [Ectocarpus fasciculatus]
MAGAALVRTHRKVGIARRYLAAGLHSSSSKTTTASTASSPQASPAPTPAAASASPAQAPAPAPVPQHAAAPRTPSLTSSSPGSPGDADDISLAMQNGELSAAARVFVPTNISPAKPPTSTGAGGTPVSRPGAAAAAAARSAGAGTPTTAAARAGQTPPRPPVAASGSSPGLRPSPGKGGGVGAGLGLPLADVAFGSSWGSMGGGGGGGVKNTSSDAADDGGGGGGGGSNLWGSLGIDVGGAGVPASGQAIWGSSSLLDSVGGDGGGSGGGGAIAGDGLSLLLGPSNGSTVQAPVDATSLPPFSSSSPLDLASWGVGGRAGAGALAGDEFVGGLASSLSGLSMDDSASGVLGGKAGEQPQQQQQQQQQRGGGFGSASSLSSWG